MPTLIRLFVVMYCNGVWGAKHPKHHYPNHYFAALPDY